MFNIRLKSSRINKRLSQKEVGDVIHVSQQAYAKWENDKATPNPDTISKLATLYDYRLLTWQRCNGYRRTWLSIKR